MELIAAVLPRGMPMSEDGLAGRLLAPRADERASVVLIARQVTGRAVATVDQLDGESRRHRLPKFSIDDYHDWLTVMQPDVAACLDLPCEEQLAADGYQGPRRQRWTLEAAGELLRKRTP